jgi:hypothetical protein
MFSAASWQKEQISSAFILAVATRAGCTLGSWNVDKDGVDVTLKRDGLMVDLQMKCSHAARNSQGDYVFDLDVATYDKLRSPIRSAPGYLGLVVVPEDMDAWIVHDRDRLLLSCAGYYAQVQDRPEAKGVQKTAIRLPRRQVIDGDGLNAMFELSLHRVLHGTNSGMVA